MHLPIEDHVLAAIRRSFATGLAYGDEKWGNELAKKAESAPHDPSPRTTSRSGSQ
jgi:hypothetical protein